MPVQIIEDSLYSAKYRNLLKTLEGKRPDEVVRLLYVDVFMDLQKGFVGKRIEGESSAIRIEGFIEHKLQKFMVMLRGQVDCSFKVVIKLEENWFETAYIVIDERKYNICEAIAKTIYPCFWKEIYSKLYTRNLYATFQP